MRINPEDTAAVIVDLQEKLMPVIHEKEAVEARNVLLIRGLKCLGIPVLLTQQYTKGLGSSLPSIYEAAGSTDYIEKSSFSCVHEPAFMEAVEATGKKTILMTGTEAHICVLQTAMDLTAMGYRVVLVTDCVGSRTERDRAAGIRRAIQEGITVTTAEAVLFELLVDSKNPHFREISKLVK